MKNATVLFCICLFMACANATPQVVVTRVDQPAAPVNDTLNKAALSVVLDAIEKLPNIKADGDKIYIDNRNITIQATVEQDVAHEGNWFLAANFVTSYDNLKLSFGSVGIGNNRMEAMQVCLEEWYGAFGVSFINMIKDSSYVRLDDKKVFAGLMGIRGELPDGSWLNGSDATTLKIMNNLQSFISASSSHITSVDLKLLINNGVLEDGECRIDNKHSPEVLNALKKMKWPVSASPFMFKQFYLIKKGTSK
ncbi:DUF6348 family protein [Edaphocola aurantiacus]|uniref:DUF6348 family protein n=1 Tax=Edaphocola aurantiacus TaxID=2601682 RepID=UPI001C988244|nr:DUF6348 family protein [Edaphocola aurantiacus]